MDTRRGEEGHAVPFARDRAPPVKVSPRLAVQLHVVVHVARDDRQVNQAPQKRPPGEIDGRHEMYHVSDGKEVALGDGQAAHETRQLVREALQLARGQAEAPGHRIEFDAQEGEDGNRALHPIRGVGQNQAVRR